MPVSPTRPGPVGRATWSTDTHGFKDGTIKVTSGRITIHSFVPVERIYPFECVGGFHSSDPLLDKIWSDVRAVPPGHE